MKTLTAVLLATAAMNLAAGDFRTITDIGPGGISFGNEYRSDMGGHFNIIHPDNSFTTGTIDRFGNRTSVTFPNASPPVHYPAFDHTKQRGFR